MINTKLIILKHKIYLRNKCCVIKESPLSIMLYLRPYFIFFNFNSAVLLFHVLFSKCTNYFLDLSHSDTRLSVMLNGFEQHVYNRCKMYNNLEKVFNLDPSIIPWDELSMSKYNLNSKV